MQDTSTPFRSECPVSHEPVDATPDARAKVQAFISNKSFPCVGAKSALNKDRMRFGQFGRLGDAACAQQVCQALAAYSEEFPTPGSTPVSFMAMFEDEPMNEAEFEQRLWAQLQAMHEVDLQRGIGWDGRVGTDPAREDFSFSIGGRAFFVVGLHPQASRKARRAPVPCLVFNFHEQFETLKGSGKYQSMQEVIRARDVALQGCVNPVLARFGEASEARQYSGRAVDANWQCPFHHRS